MNRFAHRTVALTVTTLSALALGAPAALAQDATAFARAGTVSVAGGLSMSTTSLETGLDDGNPSTDDADTTTEGSVDRYQIAPAVGFFVLDVLQLKAGFAYELEEENFDDSPVRSQVSVTSLLVGAEVDVPVDARRHVFVTGVFDYAHGVSGEWESEDDRNETTGDIEQRSARLGAGLTLAFGGESGGFVSILVSKRWVEREITNIETRDRRSSSGGYDYDDDYDYGGSDDDEEAPKIKAWPHRFGLDATFGLYF